MREFCYDCFRAKRRCFCSRVSRFRAPFDLALVVHPREERNTVGTARMVHRSILNSLWIKSKDLDQRWSELKDPVMLYPADEGGVPLSELAGRSVVVIDGTWAHARSIVNKSARLQALPKVSLDPTSPSAYQFRKQPAAECLSTVESVAQLLVSVDPAFSEQAAQMLKIFEEMVTHQLSLGGGTALRGKRV